MNKESHTVERRTTKEGFGRGNHRQRHSSARLKGVVRSKSTAGKEGRRVVTSQEWYHTLYSEPPNDQTKYKSKERRNEREGTKERTRRNEQTNKRTNEQTNKRTNEQTNKRTKERRNEGTKERTNEQRNKRTKERRNEQTFWRLAVG